MTWLLWTIAVLLVAAGLAVLLPFAFWRLLVSGPAVPGTHRQCRYRQRAAAPKPGLVDMLRADGGL